MMRNTAWRSDGAVARRRWRPEKWRARIFGRSHMILIDSRNSAAWASASFDSHQWRKCVATCRYEFYPRRWRWSRIRSCWYKSKWQAYKTLLFNNYMIKNTRSQGLLNYKNQLRFLCFYQNARQLRNYTKSSNLKWERVICSTKIWYIY